MPSETPTLLCKDYTLETRREMLLERLSLEVTDQMLLIDISTPQGRAYQWLAFEDTIDPLYCPEDPRIIQRYMLALLYYSTGGDLTWEVCAASPSTPCPGSSKRYLSPTEECDWFGVTCNALDQAKVLRLGELSFILFTYSL